MRQREVPRKWPLQQALAMARAILAGEVSMIEGSIELSSYADDIVENSSSDPDFVIFNVVSSETDDLPFGDVRSLWSQSALARADEEIRRTTELYTADVRAACEHILARFDGVETFP
jgi:Protein of unknown function (DUF2489)